MTVEYARITVECAQITVKYARITAGYARITSDWDIVILANAGIHFRPYQCTPADT